MKGVKAGGGGRRRSRGWVVVMEEMKTSRSWRRGS